VRSKKVVGVAKANIKSRKTSVKTEVKSARTNFTKFVLILEITISNAEKFVKKFFIFGNYQIYNTRTNVKNAFPLLFILLSLLFVASIFIFFKPTLAIQSDDVLTLNCSDGQIRNCTIRGCPGSSVCVEGEWHGCKWDTICSPGSIEPCLSYGCAYAYKVCNECGTGYGQCEEN